MSTNYFSKNYYPTPVGLTERMMAKLPSDQLKTMTVLEPSAGMGAIADRLKYLVKRVECIELNEHMAATLKGKGYTTIQGDFLQYSGAKAYDAIIMNPPFDAGADHLLKAWDIMRTGHIVCLLNAETLLNAHTAKRQYLAELIAENGTVEYIDNAFATADRKTGVQVALVYLHKKAKEQEAFQFKATDRPAFTLEEEAIIGENGLQRADFIKSHCDAYMNATRATTDFFAALKKIELYMSAFLSSYEREKLLSEFAKNAISRGFTEAHNLMIKELQERCWNYIFTLTNAERMVTTKVREDFHKWRLEQGGVDLTVENVTLFFEMLISQKDNIRAKCIENVFEYLTRQHKNQQVFGGEWKTNSRYMVGKKIIVQFYDNTGFTLSRSQDAMDDLDKALCMITGKQYQELYKQGSTTTQRLRGIKSYRKMSDPEPVYESEFFTFKVFNAGTVHLTWKDEELRMMFNREACAGRGWELPSEEKFRGKARRK